MYVSVTRAERVLVVRLGLRSARPRSNLPGVQGSRTAVWSDHEREDERINTSTSLCGLASARCLNARCQNLIQEIHVAHVVHAQISTNTHIHMRTRT